MAILNVSSYITSAGLQAITSAGQIGPYFSVKYFVPFYDPRFDKNITNDMYGFTSAINISALNLTSATSNTLAGEKIYASIVDQYSLSNPTYIYQQNGMGVIVDGASGVLQSKQAKLDRVNLLKGKPSLQCVSATSISASNSSAFGSFTLTNAYNVSGSRLSTYNPLSATPYPTSAFFRVQSYSPKAIGSTSATGQYKCRIPASNGSFKFNGLALYVAKVDQYGFDAPTVSPILS